MGGAASKADPQEQPEAQHISPVRISPKLLLQLAGHDAPGSSVAPGSGPGRGGPPSEAEAAQAAIEEAVRSSRQLRFALAHSTRVGELLLKSEDEELGRVHAYAEELLDHEYWAPAKPSPCESAREACVGCYSQHPQDVLKCADAVDAYKSCADQVFRQFVAR